MRSLNNFEKENIKFLTENSISTTLIEPTETGLKKSILDATGIVRKYLSDNEIHDYSIQRQEPGHKVILEAILIDADRTIKSKASLYRPKSKNGDPRIWFRRLNKIAPPNDILAIFNFENTLYVINVSRLPIERTIDSGRAAHLKNIINKIREKEGAIAQELLDRLKDIAAYGPLSSIVTGDTSVGRTLETALGIKMNASKNPDYKGIELKTFRANRGSRKNLFCQVPDWKLSKFKSSAEILDTFGYWRENVFRLYCTLSTTRKNSQGLQLRLDANNNWLYEFSDKKNINDFAVWTLKKLHERLLKKHNETFWIEAESSIISGREHFLYRKAEYTRKPITSQFDVLLEQGLITVDHLIKRKNSGSVTDKGPSFKLKSNALNLLFPPSLIYNLLPDGN